ncbi:rhodanese-like domain-containing protein [Flavobacteriaceae bacterium M23B6Z8]
MRKRVLICLFVSSLLAVNLISGQQSLAYVLNSFNNAEVPYISVDSLAQNKKAFYLLDAREQVEYNVSHLKEAVHVGYDNFEVKTVSEMIPDKESPIVVYCSIGVRSHKIAQKIKKMGYTQVFNLYGGIFEWKNQGQPVVDNTGIDTEKVHAYSKIWGIYLKKGEKVYD